MHIDLTGFTGTQAYHRSSIFSNLVHTDGVQSFCEQASAFWFLDIASTEIQELLDREYFLGIKLIVIDSQAQIQVTDGDENEMLVKDIAYTDCPHGVYEFFMTDNVLMLTSEY